MRVPRGRHFLSSGLKGYVISLGKGSRGTGGMVWGRESTGEEFEYGLAHISVVRGKPEILKRVRQGTGTLREEGPKEPLEKVVYRGESLPKRLREGVVGGSTLHDRVETGYRLFRK